MKRIVLAGLLLLAGCSEASAADSPECRRWQARYEKAEMFGTDLAAIVRAGLLEKRPEDCEIP